MNETRPRTRVRPSVLLASIPVFDALINQLSTAEISLGPFSLMQAARGAELALLVILGVWAVAHRPRIDRAFGGLVAVSVVALACMVLSEVRKYGTIDQVSIVGVIQIAFILVLWTAVSALCRQPKDCRMILIGIAAGALISALSVIVIFLRQERVTEAYGGIMATSGLFFSAKYLVGSWIVGGFIWMYLPLKRWHLLGVLSAGICFLAIFATYNRTGQLCLAMSVCWVGYWQWRQGNGGPDSRWARQLLLLSLVAAVAFLLFVGTTNLAQRWSDLADSDTAGSGRLLLWAISTLWALNAHIADLISGIGFRGMYDVIEAATGLRIHTHSDVFDLLMIAGLTGLLMYAVFVKSLWTVIKRQDRSSPAHAIGVTAFLTFLFSSLLTGQITQPTAMATYVLAILATLPLSHARGGERVAAET